MVQVFANDQLRAEVNGAIGAIVLNRPDKRNAMTQAMWQSFPDALAGLVANQAVRVIVLRSSTPAAFCAGADIDEFAEFANDPVWRRTNHAAISATQIALAQCEKPTIAEISGVCVGGGCGLANACDFRIAAPNARFGVTPAKLGLVYSLHDTKLLVDLVGASAAKLILFSARLFEAEAALAMGWITQIAPAADLSSTVLAHAQEIAANSQASVRHSKRIVREILDGAAHDTPAHAQLFFDAFDGPDHQEGVAAFREKRRPVF